MSDSTAEQGQLMTIGAVAAANIAQATGMQAHVKEIEAAIKDEISAMSSHFTLTFADIQTQYEIDLKNLTGTFSFVKANKLALLGAAVALFAVGVVVGHVL